MHARIHHAPPRILRAREPFSMSSVVMLHACAVAVAVASPLSPTHDDRSASTPNERIALTGSRPSSIGAQRRRTSLRCPPLQVALPYTHNPRTPARPPVSHVN